VLALGGGDHLLDHGLGSRRGSFGPYGGLFDLARRLLGAEGRGLGPVGGITRSEVAIVCSLSAWETRCQSS
jgi:hypothetical protein